MINRNSEIKPPFGTIGIIGRDMQIGSRIYWQFCELKDAINLPEDEKEKIIGCVIEICQKLEKVKYHANRYSEIANEYIEDFKKRSDKLGHANANCSYVNKTTGIETEVEAFLFQAKSCLDILVKVFLPLFGINLYTFKNGGKGVIKALKNSLNDKLKPKAINLIKLIEKDSLWINKFLVGDRDVVSHIKNIDWNAFIEIPRNNGKVILVPPLTSQGQPIGKYLQILYDNLLGFCEDFLALSLEIKFYPGLGLMIKKQEEIDPQYPRKFVIKINSDLSNEHLNK